MRGVIETEGLTVESTVNEGSTLPLEMRDGVNPDDTVTTALTLVYLLTETDEDVDGDVLKLPL